MESTPVKRSRRKYDADFRKEVLRMIQMGRSVPVSLGIGSNLIYQWLKRSKKKEAPAGEPAGVVFDAEKLSLQKRVKELEMERDNLKNGHEARLTHKHEKGVAYS